MPDVIGTLFHKDIPYGGVKGDKGNTGATPNISATASVDSSTGTPSVNVVKTGTAENPSFEFAFSNLKGEKGDPGSGSSVSWGEINGNIANQTDLSTELAKKYDENDTAETDIADDDYVPFYDTSATTKKKSLWSNIKDKLSAIFTLLSIVGTVENGTTASQPYKFGDHFIRNGKYCIATVDNIPQGTAFTLDTNYREGDIVNTHPRYMQVAASSASVSYATALAELQSAYTNMSSWERRNSRIRRAYSIYNVVNISGNTGVYSEIGLDGDNYVNLYQLNIMAAQYMVGKTGAVAVDRSTSNIGGNPLVLEVLGYYDY